MTNNRFSDYVTSGAFSLNLTRRQIERLEAIARNPTPHLSWDNTANALMNKGLIEEIDAPSPQNEDGRQGRLTGAGLLIVAMLAEAGLIPIELRDVAAIERDRITAELEKRRRMECEARQRARAAISRMESIELDFENHKRLNDGRKILIKITTADPRSSLSNEELRSWAFHAAAAFGFEDESV